MLGAIIGDMVGSIYEFTNGIKSKDFRIMQPYMRMTDDSLLTIAVADVLGKHYPIRYEEKKIESIKHDLINEFVLTWKRNMHAGFGSYFYKWCITVSEEGYAAPYNSFGNGSAMRISPVGWMAKSEEEVRMLSKIVTEITHNHPEGLKGAEAIALCIYLALNGSSKENIKERMEKDYYPEIAQLNFAELQKTYKFNATCQGSVPQAIYCFLMSTSLEDAIRNCIAIGGDTDTLGAMAGSIAEAFYQKNKLSKLEEDYLYLMIDPYVEKKIKTFYNIVGSRKFVRN